MNNISYLIYILSFIIGSAMGLVLSYKKYTAPFVTKNIDMVALILAIVGWVLAINSQLISAWVSPVITITVGIFLIAIVMGMRPGYGRYETVIGFAISALIWVGTVLI
jgi:energy-converting hydrogenase A subunit L